MRSKNECRTAAAMGAIGIMSLLMGCGLGPSSKSVEGVPVAGAVAGVRGMVHGGQQPISGATIYLYGANTVGYATTNQNILTVPVHSLSDGSFNITLKYSCTAGQQMYLVAVGGDPGAGVNNNSALMAALGDCNTLSASTFISVNEVTTVGSVFALAPFMGSYSAVGTSPTNVAGLARAFVSVNKLIDVGLGSVGGPALAAGATVPVAEINTLADALASCINSTGGAAGSKTPCGDLFTFATPPGGGAPTDTIGAVLSIAKNPMLSLTEITNLATPQSPFQPVLGLAPADWTVSINYKTGGFSTPASTTIDANGNVWVANSGNNTVTVLSQTGAPVSGSPFSNNGLNGPAGVAIDANGNAWVPNRGGSTVSAFTGSGGMFTGSPFSGTGLSSPSAIAIDAPGNIWVTNSGNNSVSEFTSAGAGVRQVTGGFSAPVGIAIDPK